MPSMRHAVSDLWQSTLHIDLREGLGMLFTVK